MNLGEELRVVAVVDGRRHERGVLLVAAHDEWRTPIDQHVEEAVDLRPGDPSPGARYAAVLKGLRRRAGGCLACSQVIASVSVSEP